MSASPGEFVSASSGRGGTAVTVSGPDNPKTDSMAQARSETIKEDAKQNLSACRLQYQVSYLL